MVQSTPTYAPFPITVHPTGNAAQKNVGSKATAPTTDGSTADVLPFPPPVLPCDEQKRIVGNGITTS